ncbi:MAG: hypothetical protein Fur0041_04740 [Bacteroidia bacterium]
MKKLFTLTVLAFSLIGAQAQTKISVANGDWYNPATWSPSGVPDLLTQNIIVNTNVTFSQDILIGGNCDVFRIASGASLTDLNNNDTLIIGSRIFRNEGIAVIGFLSGEPSDSTINAGSLKVLTDYVQSGICVNQQSGTICVTNQLTTGDSFINNGSVSAYRWINGAGVTGSQGKFCVADWFINGGQIMGTLDVCDATPATIFDVPGTIGSQVTYCAQGPCTLCQTTGINEYQEVVFAAYPNPVSAGNPVIIVTEERALLKIFDTQGKLIQDIQMQAGANSIATNAMQAGMYFFTVTTDAGTSTKKIVLQ